MNAESIKLHGAALYSEYCKEGDRTWTYLPYGPFDSCEHYLAWLLSLAERREGLSNDAIPCVPVLYIPHPKSHRPDSLIPGFSLSSALQPREFART